MTNEEAIARIKDHKIVHKMNEPRAIYISEALDIAIEALEQFRWIPCSERPPEDGERVIVQYGDGRLGVIERVRLKIWNLINSPYAKVVAWMPLPEPYKEGSEA